MHVGVRIYFDNKVQIFLFDERTKQVTAIENESVRQLSALV